MKTWQIWSEGYLCTGMEGIPAGAMKHGEAEGETFAEACANFAKVDGEFRRYFDPVSMTFWGCRLFDNEEDARRFLG